MKSMLFFSTLEQSNDPDKALFTWTGAQIQAVPQVGDFVSFAEGEKSWMVRHVVWRPHLARVDVVCGQWEFEV